MEKLADGTIYLVLGLLGGTGTVLLELQRSLDEGCWKGSLFWLNLFFSFGIVATLAIPVSFITGTLVELSPYPEAAPAFAFWAAVYAKDKINDPMSLLKILRGKP